MEYITAKQFLKQEDIVQKAFLEWWKPSVGDLATNRHDSIDVLKSNRDIEAVRVYKGQPYAIPLLTIGQLIEFIEDITGMKVIFEYTCCENIVIKLLEYNKVTGGLEYKYKMTFPQNKYSLIEAFWRVACIKARGEING